MSVVNDDFFEEEDMSVVNDDFVKNSSSSNQFWMIQNG